MEEVRFSLLRSTDKTKEMCTMNLKQMILNTCSKKILIKASMYITFKYFTVFSQITGRLFLTKNVYIFHSKCDT